MGSPSFAYLRSSMTEEQRSILDDVWIHLKERNVGIPERPLFEKYGKEKLRQVAAKLGGTIINNRHEENKLRYDLGVVGIFLTSDGPRLEDLVAKYLVVLRDAYARNRDIERFSSKDLASWAPELTQSELHELRLILYRAQGSLASRVSGWNADEWFVTVDDDVVELKHLADLRAYVESRILKWYEPKQPADEIERMTHQAPYPSTVTWIDEFLESRSKSSNNQGNASNKKRKLRRSQKRSARPAARLNLSFISDDAPLRRILNADWKEAIQNFKGKAWKSCVVLCGGIIEGLLLWQLERAQRIATKDSGTDIRYDGEMLSGVIRQSKEQGLIGRDEEFLVQWARTYRNIIHPGNQRRERRTPAKSHADLALKLVEVVAEGVRRNTGTKQ